MNFEEMVKEMETLRKKMAEEMFQDFENLERKFKNGDLDGNWKFEHIDEPGMKGFIARGFFSTPGIPRIPEPEVPKPLDTDPREPLYDLRDGDDTVQLFIELPGVEKDEITLAPHDGDLEVNAKNFHTIIELPKGAIYSDKVSTELRNGILTVTIPKIKGVEL